MKKLRIAVLLSVLSLLPTLALAQLDSSSLATISGTVVDKTGAAVAGAEVRLSFENRVPQQTAVSDRNGQFSFTKIAPGAFHLTVTAKGFAEVATAGTARAGETVTLPSTVLEVARVTRIPAAVEVISAGTCDTKPSPIDKIVKCCKASPIVIPF